MYSCRPPDKSNPVVELQLKGKQYQSTNRDVDDPPYNFQVFHRLYIQLKWYDKYNLMSTRVYYKLYYFYRIVRINKPYNGTVQ